MSYREVCHCTHDKSTHARVGDERCNCLASGCECRRYISENDPKPPPVLVRPPKHPAFCKCARCAAYDKAHPPSQPVVDPRDTPSGPPTWPLPWGVP